MVLDIFNEEGVEQYDFKELAVQYDIRPCIPERPQGQKGYSLFSGG